MADGWSTTVTDWQGIDDVPTAGSDNLVKSGGVAISFNKKAPFVNADANAAIPVLFLDLNGYTGSADTSVIKIRNLMAGTSNYWGLSLNDKNGNLLVDVDVVRENAKPKYLEKKASNGIYIYAEFNWGALPELGVNYSFGGNCSVTPYVFLGDYKRLYNLEQEKLLKYSSQILTNNEKTTARENINAVSEDDMKSFIGITNPIETSFDQGVIGSQGQLVNSSTRISSHFIKGPFKVKIKTGYLIRIISEYSTNSASSHITNDPMHINDGLINVKEVNYCNNDYAKIVVTKEDGTSEISASENVIEDLTTLSFGTEIEVKFDKEGVYYNNETGVTVSLSGTALTSCFYPLDGYKYRFTGGVNNNIAAFCFFDEHQSFLGASPAHSEKVYYIDTDIENISLIPTGAKYVRFSAYKSNDNFCCVKCVRIGEENNILKWKGKKWACVGDSLTDLGDRANVRYFDFVKIETGILPINYGKAGSGYAKKQEQNQAFYQRVSSIPIDVNVITIFGSFNDLWDSLELGTPSDTGTTTLCGCINTTLDNIFTRIPLAVVGIVTPTPWGDCMPSRDDATGLKYKNYVEALITIAKNRSIPYLDLWRCSNFRMDDTTFKQTIFPIDLDRGQQAVHPNDKGNEIIAPKFKDFLESLIL